MRLLLVDPHPIIHAAVRDLFAHDLTAEMMMAQTCAEALAIVDKSRLDVIVVEIELPDGSGIDLVCRIAGLAPTTGLVVFSRRADADSAWRCLQAGATGVVGKTDAPADLRRCALSAATGESWLPERLKQEIAYMRISGAGSRDAFSMRELRILRALSRGKSLTEIAHDNEISYKTVTNELAQIRARLDARTQPEMIRIAMERGLLT